MRIDSQIALIGEALIDHFPDSQVIGGAPFNVARHLAGFSQTPLFISRFGLDAAAQRLFAAMDDAGLSTLGVQTDEALPTGYVRVTLDRNGHQFYIPPNQAWDAIDASAAQTALAQTPTQVLCFGTLAQRTATSRITIQQAAGAVKAAGGRVVLDLNLRDVPDNRAIAEQSLPLANVLKVNEDELRQLILWFDTKQAARATWSSDLSDRAVERLASHFGLSLIVVTRGADGYAAFADGQRVCEGKSPKPVRLIDTVGAGDAFLSVLLLGQQLNWPLPITLKRSASLAAAICGVRGAVPQDKTFYTPWMQQWSLVGQSGQSKQATTRCKNAIH